MGLPFYKAFLLDNKKAINEADGLTALEAATMFTQKEFKHLEKSVKALKKLKLKVSVKQYKNQSILMSLSTRYQVIFTMKQVEM